MEEARAAVAMLCQARPEDLVPVRNATTGVAAVLASLTLQPGDELLRTSHGYNACNNILARAAERAGPASWWRRAAVSPSHPRKKWSVRCFRR